MLFYFEKVTKDLQCSNFKNFSDLNTSGLPRFWISPTSSALLRYSQTMEVSPSNNILKKIRYTGNKIPNEKYIYAFSVGHSPIEWCGPDNKENGYNSDYPNRKNLFECLPKEQLINLKEGKMFLMIDQSHEGYHAPWLWDWFHNSCNYYGVNPKQIIYITGDLLSRKSYEEWQKTHSIENKLLVLPYAHFENLIKENAIKTKIPTVKDHFKFKMKDLESIKVYNALQKRPRNHRYWLIKNIIKNGLLDDGINTCNFFKLDQTFFEGKSDNKIEFDEINKFLPLIKDFNRTEQSVFFSGDCGLFLERLNDDVMLQSWISVISEASVADSDDQCFISEKTFKPLACCHPFIIYGNRYSLEKIRDLGYKTFSPYINESYDTLPTWERLAAIINELKRLQAMTLAERSKWFFNMSDILKYNQEHLLKFYTDRMPNAIHELDEFWSKNVSESS